METHRRLEQIYTIVDSVTYEEIGATNIELNLINNEVLVPELRTVWYLKPYFNFDTKEFYEGATQQELDDYNDIY
jgi:hypothetical protein